MKINKSYIGSYLIAFLRVFINFIIISLIWLVIIKLLTDYQIINSTYIIYGALSYSIVYSFAFIVKTDIISFTNKENFIVNLKEILHKKKYKIISEKNNKILIKPSWFYRLFTTNILIEICNTEAKLTGAAQLVRDIKDSYKCTS